MKNKSLTRWWTTLTRRARPRRVSDTGLAFDEERTVAAKSCTSCGRDYTLVKGFIFRGEDPNSVFFAALHDHDGHEAWIDVILGTFGSDDFTDHITFGCRVGAVADQNEPASTLVAAAQPFGQSSLFGRKLSRDEALEHPWLPLFWEISDFVLLADPDVRRHVLG